MPSPTPHIIVLNALVGNPPAVLSPMQTAMAAHLDLLIFSWSAIWCTAAIFALRHLYMEIRHELQKRRS